MTANHIESLTDDELIARYELSTNYIVRELVNRLVELTDHAAGLQRDLECALFDKENLHFESLRVARWLQDAPVVKQ